MALRRTLPALVLNVPSIAYKSPIEVGRVLGKPVRSGSSRVSMNPTSAYHAGKIEVTFNEERADRIVLNDARGLTFHKESLAKLGLPVSRPTYKNRNHVLRWDNIPGIKDVSLFAGHNGGVSCVSITVGVGSKA